MSLKYKSYFFVEILYLILIYLSFLQFRLSLLLERDYNQGHEDVDKEEREDNEVNNVEYGHLYPIHGDGALILISYSHRLLQDPESCNNNISAAWSDQLLVS